jgi:hypothetical protein
MEDALIRANICTAYHLLKDAVNSTTNSLNNNLPSDYPLIDAFIPTLFHTVSTTPSAAQELLNIKRNKTLLHNLYATLPDPSQSPITISGSCATNLDAGPDPMNYISTPSAQVNYLAPR